jgi:hypothetical protein
MAQGQGNLPFHEPEQTNERPDDDNADGKDEEQRQDVEHSRAMESVRGHCCGAFAHGDRRGLGHGRQESRRNDSCDRFRNCFLGGGEGGSGGQGPGGEIGLRDDGKVPRISGRCHCGEE